MRTKALLKYELRYVKNYGEIGAGRVVPFVPREDYVPVVVPEGVPADDSVGTLTVRGVSLEEEGIFDGDQLVLKRNFTKRDIKPDTICAVYIQSTGELVAKKVFASPFKGHVILRASGGGLKDIHVPEDDIEIRGVVFAFIRMVGSDGRFPKQKAVGYEEF
jgi:SOS-response transcriptional repressor LexA